MTGRMRVLCLVGWMAVAGWAAPAVCQEAAAVDAVRKNAEKREKSFNAAQVDEVVGMFMPQGELIDEEGVVYKGQAEIKSLLTAFFERFPGAKLSLDVESIRLVGPVAIEEGTRTMSSAEGDVQSRFRYIAVWAKADEGQWRLASFRDFVDDPVPTPHDYLQPLAWLVGDWVNEGTDGKVAVSYRWSDDRNYLLGEFNFTTPEGVERKSTQRLGWDPAKGKIRAWLFDADGGFAEGDWTIVDDGSVVVKSSSVNPDGSTSTATLTITPTDDDHYTIAGTDRIVGGVLEPDFEITVARRPPAAGN
ncbi:MAG: SgcJ/EcaC family oxidoreductase [Planctomycetota bacterium]|nr:MAG: SgcJ/EcaC family oxidoreductase [Planctomycetota bacterium]